MEKNNKAKNVAQLYTKFITEFDKDWPVGCENEFSQRPLVGTYRDVTFVTNNTFMFDMFYRIQKDGKDADQAKSRGLMYVESQKLESQLVDKIVNGDFTSGIYLVQDKIEPKCRALNASHGCGRALILAKTAKNLEEVFDSIVYEHIRCVQIALDREPKGIWEDKGIWPYHNPRFPSLSAEVVLNGRPYPHETSELFKGIDHPHLGGQYERLSHSLRLARLRYERENPTL